MTLVSIITNITMGTTITAITHVYQQYAAGKDPGKHPFTKYFEELEVGDQIITEKRTITSEDIDKFADLSGDHFYAHIKTTDFEGTMFEQQVAIRMLRIPELLCVPGHAFSLFE